MDLSLRDIAIPSIILSSLYLGYKAYRFYIADADLQTYNSTLKPEYFEDKIIWVTGASSGIGLEIVKRIVLFNLNSKIILSSRRKEALENVRDDMLELVPNFPKDNIKIVPLDLEDLDSLDSKTEEAINQFGKIDILVNNGGVSTRSLSRDSKFEVEEKVFKIDFLSAVKITKRVLQVMINPGENKTNQKPHLHIINISSIAGKIFITMRTSYCAAKAALIMYFDALRLEEPDLLTVTNVCPGSVQTSVAKNALTADGSSFGKTDENIANGMTVERCVDLILAGASNKVYEIWIFKIMREKIGTYMGQYIPGIFRNRIMENAIRVKHEYTDRVLKQQ